MMGVNDMNALRDDELEGVSGGKRNSAVKTTNVKSANSQSAEFTKAWNAFNLDETYSGIARGEIYSAYCEVADKTDVKTFLEDYRV